MKTIIKSAISATLIALIVIVAGCASTPKARETRQQVFGTGILLSAAVMQGYVTIATSKCGTDTNCLNEVRRTHAIYTNAVNAAMTAWTTYEQYGTNYSTMMKTIGAITSAQYDVTAAIMAAMDKK